jgi:hypothetical protein
MTQIITGSELKVGDTITVWWGSNRDTIIGLVPYVEFSPLMSLFPNGARIATFAINQGGMTIENDGRYELVSRQRLLAPSHQHQIEECRTCLPRKSLAT